MVVCASLVAEIPEGHGATPNGNNRFQILQNYKYLPETLVVVIYICMHAIIHTCTHTHTHTHTLKQKIKLSQLHQS